MSSALKDITPGVPQGPLLFILYINDLTMSYKILKFILFADDTNFSYSGKNIVELLAAVNIEMEHVSTWFRANMLSVNIKKHNYILFGSKHKLYNMSGLLK